VLFRSLLTHSSGIPDTWLFNDSPDQVMASIGKSPLKFEPGSQYTYSRTGYIALGKVIEAVSGETYEAFLQQNIFDPLKMTSTGYDHGQADLAIGYTSAGGQAAMLPNPQAMFASGGLYSTVEDLNRWDQTLYTSQLVSAKTLETVFTPHIITSFAPWTSSYGFIILPSSPRVVETSTNLTGISGVYDRYPDQKVIVILLANQQTETLYDLSGLVSHVMIGN
jgi:CubicO group peptidase (beta-lactamase class C family)